MIGPYIEPPDLRWGNLLILIAFFVPLAFLGFTVSSSGITGFSISVGEDQWEDSVIIEATSAEKMIDNRITFDQYKPTVCSQSILVMTSEGQVVGFTTSDEVYLNGVCQEVTISFDNILAASSTTGLSPLTGFASTGEVLSPAFGITLPPESEIDINSEVASEPNSTSPEQIFTYTVYYGRITQPEELPIEEPVVEEPTVELLPPVSPPAGTVIVQEIKVQQQAAQIDEPVKWIERIRVENTGEELTSDVSESVPDEATRIVIRDVSGDYRFTPKMLANDPSPSKEVIFMDKLGPAEIKEFDLEYETPAPRKIEGTPVELEGKWRKNVTIRSDVAVHYRDVLSRSSIPETDPNMVKLYWNINSTRVDVTDDPRFSVQKLDTNGDGTIDQLTWIVPQLSTQEFEIVIDLVILNPIESVQVGDSWIVYFNTTGTAKLNITKDWMADEVLAFNNISCGGTLIDPLIDGPSVIVYNWTCDNQTASIDHTKINDTYPVFSQEFRFGEGNGTIVDYAYDPTFCEEYTGPPAPDCDTACGIPPAPPPSYVGHEGDIAAGSCYSDVICSAPCGGGCTSNAECAGDGSEYCDVNGACVPDEAAGTACNVAYAGPSEFDGVCGAPNLGNCDPDFVDGTYRCHTTASSCVIDDTGTETPTSNGLCNTNYDYKTCTSATWSSLTHVTDGNVCSSGTNAQPSSGTNCAVWRDCSVDACAANEYYVGYQSTGSSCSGTDWVSKGTSWNATSNYIINTNTDGTICSETNTGKSASYDACSNQYTRIGPDGYCDGAGSLDTNDASTAVTVGDVCFQGTSINPNSSSICGTGAQNCYAAVWRDCVVDACSASEYYTGFSGGSPTATGWVAKGTSWNAADNYIINTNTDGTTCSETNTGKSASYDACSNAYTRQGPDGYCDGSGALDTNDALLNVSAGNVCSSGSDAQPSSGINCDTYLDCNSGSCSASFYYAGYAGDGTSSCSTTDWVASGSSWNAGSSTTISVTTDTISASCTTSGTTYCSGTDSCSVSTLYTDEVCNGAGACTVAANGGACANNLICADATTCKSSCSLDADCVSGYHCDASACVADLANGQICNEDSDCISANCDTDFDTATQYCHATATSCTDYTLGDPWEQATGYELCSGNSYYKSCSSSTWGSQQNSPDTANDYCDAGGGSQSGYDLLATCSSGASGGFSDPSCTSCSPYLAASTSSCKTSCSSDADCYGSNVCSGSVCVGDNAPTLSAKELYPASPTTSDTLSLKVTCKDGEQSSLTAIWWIWKGATNQTSLGGSTSVSNNTETTVKTILSGNTSKSEQWKAEVWCFDGTTSTSHANTSTRTIQNTAPTTPSIPSITSPSTAYKSSTLTSSTGTGSSDPDETPTYWYKWYDGGVLQTGTGATFDCSASGSCTKGDSIQVATLASDGSANSSWTSYSTGKTIQNSAPSITTTEPDGSGDSDIDSSYTVTWSASDVDSDTLTVSCYADADTSGYTKTYTCFTGATNDGTQSCTTSSWSQGSYYIWCNSTESGGLYAEDYSPGQLQINHAPTSFAANDGGATIVNNDTDVSMSSTWTDSSDTVGLYVSYTASDSSCKNGATSNCECSQTAQTDGSGACTIDTAGQGGTKTWYAWACDDQNRCSSQVSDTFEVNRYPSFSSTSISPGLVYNDTALTGSVAGFSDPDSDLAGTHTYKWYKNNAVIAGETTTSLAAINFKEGDVIIFEGTPVDEHGYAGGPVNSSSETVLNTAPTTPTTLTLTNPVYVGNTLTATGSGSTDVDTADTLTYYYEFYNNDDTTTVQIYSTDNTYVLQTTDAHDTIRVRTKVNDGTTYSGEKEATRSVSNTAPSAGTVSITPSSPEDANDLTATPASFTDADSDSLSYEYKWYKNNAEISAATASILLNGNTSASDEIIASARAYDGITYSAWVNSSMKVISASTCGGDYSGSGDFTVTGESICEDSSERTIAGKTIIQNGGILHVTGSGLYNFTDGIEIQAGGLLNVTGAEAHFYKGNTILDLNDGAIFHNANVEFYGATSFDGQTNVTNSNLDFYGDLTITGEVNSDPSNWTTKQGDVLISGTTTLNDDGWWINGNLIITATGTLNLTNGSAVSMNSTTSHGQYSIEIDAGGNLVLYDNASFINKTGTYRYDIGDPTGPYIWEGTITTEGNIDDVNDMDAGVNALFKTRVTTGVPNVTIEGNFNRDMTVGTAWTMGHSKFIFRGTANPNTIDLSAEAPTAQLIFYDLEIDSGSNNDINYKNELNVTNDLTITSGNLIPATAPDNFGIAVGRDVLIKSTGALDIVAEEINVSRDWNSTEGTVSATEGVVRLDGNAGRTGVITGKNQVFVAGGAPKLIVDRGGYSTDPYIFQNGDVTGITLFELHKGGEWNVSSDIGTPYTLEAATIDAATYGTGSQQIDGGLGTIEVSSSWDSWGGAGGSYEKSTVNITGDVTSTPGEYYNLIIYDGGNVEDSGSPDVYGDFTINSGGKYNLTSGTLAVTGAVTSNGILNISGTVKAGGNWDTSTSGSLVAQTNSVVNLTNTGTLSVNSANDIYDLVVSGGTRTLASNVDLTDDLTVEAGTLKLSSYTMIVADDYSNSGDFYGGTGTLKVGGNFDHSGVGTVSEGTSTINLTGTGTMNIPAGTGADTYFYNLIVANPSKTTTLIQDKFPQVLGTLTFGSGTINTSAGTATIIVKGSVTKPITTTISNIILKIEEDGAFSLPAATSSKPYYRIWISDDSAGAPRVTLAGDTYISDTGSSALQIDAGNRWLDAASHHLNVSGTTLIYGKLNASSGGIQTNNLDLQAGGLVDITGGGSINATGTTTLTPTSNITFTDGKTYDLKINSTNITYASGSNFVIYNLKTIPDDNNGFGNTSIYVNMTNLTTGVTVDLNLSYNEADIHPSTTESQLKLWHYDEDSSLWTKFSGTYVDQTNNIVWGQVNAFSPTGGGGDTPTCPTMPITDAQSIDGLNCVYSENIVISGSGTLTMQNGGNLTINSGSDGQYDILMTSGTTLTINSGSVINASNSAYRYDIQTAGTIAMSETMQHSRNVDINESSGVFNLNGNTLTIGGDVTLDGKLVAGGSQAITMGSLDINANGNYSATSGTTTITSEFIPGGYAFQSTGAFVHNDGIINITKGDATRIDVNSAINDLFIGQPSGFYVLMSDDLTINGDLTIPSGAGLACSLGTEYTCYNLDVSGNATINGWLNMTVPDGTATVAFGNLTIGSGGVYNATNGVTNITQDFSNSGTLVENQGTFQFVGSLASSIDQETYYDLAIYKSSATAETTGTGATVTNELTVTSGTFKINSGDTVKTTNLWKTGGTLNMISTAVLNVTNNLTSTGGSATPAGIYVGGNISISGGSFTSNSGYVRMYGTQNSTLYMVNGDKLGSLFIEKDSSSEVKLTGFVRVASGVTQNSGTLDFNSNQITIDAGEYTANDGVLRMGPGSTLFLAYDTSVSDIPFQIVGSSWSEDITGGTIRVTGSKLLGAVAADFATGTDFTPQGGNFTIEGGVTQGINIDGNVKFYNFVVQKTCCIASVSDPLTVTNDMYVLAGEFEADSNVVNVSGTLYVTGGTMDLSAGGNHQFGNISVASTGTYIATPGVTTLNGNMTVDASGTFTHSSGTVVLAQSGTLDMGATSNVFNNLNITEGVTLTLGASNVQVNNVLNISGTTAGSKVVRISGSSANPLVLGSNADLSGISTLEIKTSGNSNIPAIASARNLQTLTLEYGSGTRTHTMLGDLYAQNLRISSAGSANVAFDANGYDLTVAGDVTLGQAATYTGTLHGRTGAMSFGSLTVQPTGTYNATSSTTTMNGDLAVDASGTFTSNSGEVTFAVSANLDAPYGAGYLYNLTIDSGVTVTVLNNNPAWNGKLMLNGILAGTSRTIYPSGTLGNGDADSSNWFAIGVSGGFTESSTITLALENSAGTYVLPDLPSSKNVYRLQIYSGGARTIKVPSSGELDVEDTIVVGTAGSSNVVLDANGGNITAGGDVTLGQAATYTGTLHGRTGAMSFGSLTIQSTGTYNATSGTTTIGNVNTAQDAVIYDNSGTFTSNSGTVYFNPGATNTIIQTGGAGSTKQFGDVNFSITASTQNLLINNGDLNVTGDLTVMDGNVLSAYGDLSKVYVTGDVIIQSGGKLGTTGNYALGDSSFGALTINNGGTYSATGGTTNITSNFVNSGTFDANGGNMQFVGASNSNIASATYSDLTIWKDSTSYTVTPGGALTIGNDLSITNGVFDNAGYTHTVSGDYWKSGGQHNLDSASDNLTVLGNLTSTGGTLLDSLSTVTRVYVSGNLSITGTTFDMDGASKLYLNGATNTTLSTGTGNNVGEYLYIDKNAANKVTFNSAILGEYLVHNSGFLDINGQTVTLTTGVYYGKGGTLIMDSGLLEINVGLDTGSYSPFYVASGWSELISGGTIRVDGGLHNTYGTVFFASGSDFTPTGGTFEIDGNDLENGQIHINESSTTFYNLDIDRAGDIVTLFYGDATVTNELTVTAGTFDTRSSTNNIDVTGASKIKGTLDLSAGGNHQFGSMNITSTGIYSATSGTTTITGSAGYLDVDTGGTFTHNAGSVDFTGGGSMTIGGTASSITFYTMDVSFGSGTLTSNKDLTIISSTDTSNEFKFDTSSSARTLTLGNSTQAATVTGSYVGIEASSPAYQLRVYAADSSQPYVITSGGIRFDHGATDIVHLKWCDYQTSLTSGTSDTDTITLDGNCEFDDLTVASGDTFNTNGYVANITGYLNVSGTFQGRTAAQYHGSLNNTGTYNASSGTTTISGNFDNDGTFTHNGGEVKFTGSSNNEYNNNGGTVDTVFYNLTNNVNTGMRLQVYDNMTVINVLNVTGGVYTLRNSAILTMGNSTQSGTIDTPVGGADNNFDPFQTVYVYGANQLYPVNIIGNDWLWSSLSTTNTHLKWTNFNFDITTSNGGANANTITLDGDAEFDAFTISLGDTLDLNGQRAEFSGLFNNSGTVDWDNSLVYFNASNELDAGSTNNNVGTSTLIFNGYSSSDAADFYDSGGNAFDTVVINTGSNSAQDIGGTSSSRINEFIFASGNATSISNPKWGNLTIANGGTLNGGSINFDISEDWTSSGGLLGASALSLNGSQYATTASQPLGASKNVTFEAWVNPALGATDTQHIVQEGGRGDGYHLFWNAKSAYSCGEDDNVSMVIWASSSCDSVGVPTANYPDDRWYHIVGIYEYGSRLALYIDGELVANKSTSLNVGTHGCDLNIGGDFCNYDGGFNGSIDEVRVWSEVRSETQIRDNMFKQCTQLTGTTNLESCYSVNEGTSTTLNDEGNDNIDLTLTNVDSTNDGWADGGTFIEGTSTVNMTGTGTIKYAPLDTFYNLEVAQAGKTTSIWNPTGGINPDNLRIAGTLTLGSGTFNQDTNNADIEMRSSGTFVDNGATFADIYRLQWSSTSDIPALTGQRLQHFTNTVNITGNMNLTTDLEVNSGTIISNGYNITTETATILGTLNLTAGSTLNFTSTSGFGASSGNLNALGTSGNRVTITGNNWMSSNTLNWYARYTTIEDHNRVRVNSGGSVDMIDVIFDNASFAGFQFDGSPTVTNFANITIQNSQADGLIPGTTAVFNNITISNSAGDDIDFQGVAKSPEFLDSSFSTSKVNLASTGNVISKNHNDVANDYYIWSTDLSKNVITNDMDANSRVTVYTGDFDVNEAADLYNLSILNGGNWSQGAGITTKIDTDSGVRVQSGGNLDAIGTSGSHTTMTRADGDVGQWDLTVENGATTNFTYADLKYVNATFNATSTMTNVNISQAGDFTIYSDVILTLINSVFEAITGAMFTLFGTLDLQSSNATFYDLNVTTTGNLTASGESYVTINNDFTCANATTFVKNTAITGDLTLNSGCTLTMSGGANLDVSGNFNINSGAIFNAGSGTITIIGSTDVYGTFNANSATLILHSGGSSFGLAVENPGTFNGGTGTHTYGSIWTAASSNTVFNPTSGSATVDSVYSATGDIVRFSSAITSSSGNFTITTASDGNIDVSDNLIEDLTLTPSSGTPTYTLQADTVLSGDLTVSSGATLDTSDGTDWTLTVTGDVDITGTLQGRTGAMSFGSLTINNLGTYNATSGTTTIRNTDGSYAFNLVSGGTFTHNNGTVVFATDVSSSSYRAKQAGTGNFWNLRKTSGTLSGKSLFVDTNINIDNDLIVDDGEFYSRPYYSSTGEHAITVAGDVTVNGTGQFITHNDFGGTDVNHSFGSLTINSGGTYDATSGTTTITSTVDSVSGNFALNNDGTLTANSGKFNFTCDVAVCVLDIINTGNLYDVEIATSNTVRNANDDGTIDNDLTVTSGTFSSENGNGATGITLTVTGDVTVGGTLDLKTTTTNQDYSFGSLTINSGGTYSATSGTTTVTNGNLIRRDGGTFTDNSGTVMFNTSGYIIGLNSTHDLSKLTVSSGYNVSMMADTNLTASGDVTANGELDLHQNALSFDGSDDFVNVSDSSSLSVTGDLTISAWIKLNTLSTGGTPTIVSKYDASGGQRSYLLAFDHSDCADNYIDLAISSTTNPYNGFSQCSDTALAVDTWYHVIAVFDAGNGASIYIDGVNHTGSLVGTMQSSIADSSRDLAIGAGYGNSATPNADYFNGTIDEVRIYNRSLSAAEVAELYKNTYSNNTGLVGYWDLEEGTGQTVADKSGNSNDGTRGADSGSASDDPAWVVPDVSLGSLTIPSGGAYNATSGTTTITNITSDSYSVKNSGTFTHNNGTLRLNVGTYNNLLNLGSSTAWDINHTATTFTRYGYGTALTVENDVYSNGGANTVRFIDNDVTVQGDVIVNTGGVYADGYDMSFGSLTIASGAEYRATEKTTTISGNFDNDGTFTHNGGTVKFDTDSSQYNGTVDTTFYNILVDEGELYFVQNMTVINLLNMTSSAGDESRINADAAGRAVKLTIGNSTQAGTINVEGSAQFDIRQGDASGEDVIIYGAAQLYPISVTGNDWDWNDGTGGSGKIYLKWLDYDPDVTTNTGNVYIILDGDAEFDAFTVSAGDTLDLNGQRAEFSGLLNNIGTLTDSGLKSLVVANNIDTTGTVRNIAGASDLILDGSGNIYWSATGGGWNSVLFNGGTYDTWAGSNTFGTVIFGAGELDINQDTTFENITIANGGTLDGMSKKITVSEDWTSSGGLIGKSAVDFERDDAGDYINLSSDSSLDITGAITLEIWYKPESLANDKTLIRRKAAPNHNDAYYFVGLDTTNGYPYGGVRNGGSYSVLTGTNDAVSAGRWVHLAFTYDGSNTYLYKNGKLVQKGTYSAGIGDLSGEPVYIGGEVSNSGDWSDGVVAMARIWNDSRTESELRSTLFSKCSEISDANLVSCYQFDEGTGSTTADSEDLNSGSIIGATWASAGTFTEGTSTVNMTGSAAQTLRPGSGEDFYNLEIANSGSEVNLTQAATINNALTISNGDLELAANLITPGFTIPAGSRVEISSSAAFKPSSAMTLTPTSNITFTDGEATGLLVNGTNATYINGSNFAVYNLKAAPADVAPFISAGEYMNITNTTTSAYLDLNISYTDGAQTGPESGLSMWKYNDSWYNLTGSKVDTTNDIVWVEGVTSFSTFAPGTSGVPPKWSNPVKNDSSIYQDDIVQFNMTWDADTTASRTLSSWVFSWNDSGSWQNVSSAGMIGTTNVSSTSQQVTSAADTVVGWRYYANDSQDEWNVSDVQAFVVATKSISIGLSQGIQGGIGWAISNLSVTDPHNATGNNEYYLDFDGSDDYVNVGNDNSLNPSSITISTWVKTGILNAHQSVVEKRYDAGYELLATDTVGKPYFNAKIGGTYYAYLLQDSDSLTADTWTHLAVTWDGSIATLYVDGVVKDTNSIPSGSLATPIESLYIGRRAGSSIPFNGSIDEVRIYNRALSAAEVNDTRDGVYTNNTGLVGYWSFSDTTGQTAYDRSSNSNDGQLGSSSGSDSADPTWTRTAPIETTLYYLSIDATGTLVDTYIKASGDLKTPDLSGTIKLGNQSFSNSTTNSSLPSPTLYALTTSYADNYVAKDMSSGTFAWLKFYLTVPAGTSAGSYNNTITFKAVEDGETP